MTDLAASLGAQRLAGERARHRHRWDRVTTWQDTGAGTGPGSSPACRCGALRDPAKSARGTSARRLGHDQERRIERVYGPRKVGEFGDAIDLIGRDFMWQSKATRSKVPVIAVGIWTVPPRAYIGNLMTAMLGLRRDKAPLVIRSWVRTGVSVVDVIYVYGRDWGALHSIPESWADEVVAMTGAYFLNTHGRDGPKEEAI